MSENDSVEPKGNQPNVINSTADAVKVEAVAGSGKTTTMVKRIQEDIESRDTPPNRILVLTFANEAAHSIREKLREELGPHRAFEVDVYTYHSFSYQLIKEHAYHLGLSPDFELIAEEQRPRVIETVYDEVNFEFVAAGDPVAGGSNRGTLSELETFIESMRREMVDPSEIERYLPDDETVKRLLGQVESLQAAALDLVGTDENEDINDGEGLMWNEDVLAERCRRLSLVYGGQADGLDATSHATTSIRDALRAMEDIANDLSTHLQTGGNLEWQDYRLPEAIFADSKFKSIIQTPFGRLQNYVDMLRRAKAFNDAYHAYLDELEERGALDYDELIHTTVELLRDDEARHPILSRWDQVYCDEFQDTDESQLELVEELRDDLQILVVGDSDQAIHEWRGQDPENMAKLPDSFVEIDLEQNYRSRQPILDLTNNLDREKKRINAYKEDNHPSVFRVNSEGQETTAQVSTTVSHLLTGRFDDVEQRELEDIAILVRQNSQARSIAKQLDEESIPYTLSNDTSEDLGQGVQTVLSYLSILVSPEDDVHWQRVLLHLYRVPEADIDTLLEAGETIPAGYEMLDDSAYERPENVERALSDYATLQEIAATHSISEFYRHLKHETRVEWFIRENDREALQNIDQLISSFNDSPIQSRLTEGFVEYLREQAGFLAQGSETATSQGSHSKNAIDVMTVHQAKGLDFDTVLLPFLTKDEFGGITLRNYQEKIYKYDILVDEISGALSDPIRADLSEDQIAEEWRILHVALTRAKENLFFFGHSVDSGDKSAQMLDRFLPRQGSSISIDWSAEGPAFPIWEALTESYGMIDTDAVRDYTDVVNQGVAEDPGKITYYGHDLSTENAIETLLQFTDRFIEGRLDTDNVDISHFADAPLGQELEVALSRQHSHSALEAVRDCERRHVLDYVVDAFMDPYRSSTTQSGISQTDIGTLFHDVAELAYWRGYDGEDDWKSACQWISASRGLEDAVEEASACIERYFETDVPAWDELGSEVPIELDDLEDVSGEVTGYVDSVRDYPDGGLAVIDYKTTEEQKTLQESYQLLLYIKACEGRFDDDITHAGYVYVGEAGPAVQMFEVAELESMRDSLHNNLIKADNSSFANASPGSHCQFCKHRSLGCAPDEYVYDGGFDRSA